jgi:hypothetical protein
MSSMLLGNYAHKYNKLKPRSYVRNNKSPKIELIFHQAHHFIKTNYAYLLAAGILNSDASATYR